MTSPPDDAPRDFGSFLLELARGKTHDELSQALHDVVAKVIDRGKIEILFKDGSRTMAHGQP